MHLLRDLWISITICAAIVTGLSLYSGALAETVSQIVSDAEKAEKAGAYNRAIDLYSNALASDSISNTERRKILKQRAWVNERINQIDRPPKTGRAPSIFNRSIPICMVLEAFSICVIIGMTMRLQILQEARRLTQNRRPLHTARAVCIPSAEGLTRRSTPTTRQYHSDRIT